MALCWNVFTGCIVDGYRDENLDPESRDTVYIVGIPRMKLLLMDVTSLTRAFLLQTARLVGEAALITQILPTIKHVERLTLSNSCIEVLIGAAKEKHLVSPFPKANFLELKIDFQDHQFERIVDAIEMFPGLRNLVLETTYRNVAKDGEGRRLKFERNFPRSFLSQLRRVDVSWSWSWGDDCIYQLIQFFLKYARNLKKMVFRVKGIEPRTSWKSLFMASQKLLRMEKSSPTAELIFC